GLTNIRGAVLLALWDALKEANVSIPFPHREVIFKTPLEVASASAQVAPAPRARRKPAAKRQT
ncbi:MAG: mechanosensitive ion channel family protein, partial [Nitratireductor sp.]|nr:mechanosensitive ion channel family protein [Nitratireductor sp.]